MALKLKMGLTFLLGHAQSHRMFNNKPNKASQFTPAVAGGVRHLMEREDQPNVIVSVIVTNGSKVLMVQESKPKHKGKWNIPGGHTIRGETVLEAAARELQEETNIASELDSLIGIYSSSHSVRFVFRAKIPKIEPTAGHEIQTVAFFTFTEVMLWPDETLVAPKNLKLMLKHASEGKTYPIEQMIDNR